MKEWGSVGRGPYLSVMLTTPKEEVHEWNPR